MRISFIIFLILILKNENVSNQDDKWHNFNAFFDFSSIDTNDSIMKEKIKKICQIIQNYLFWTFKIKGEQEIDLSNIKKEDNFYSLVTNYGEKIKNFDYAFKVMLSDNTKPNSFLINYNSKRKRSYICTMNITTLFLEKIYYDESFFDTIFGVLQDVFVCLGYNYKGLKSLKNINYNSEFYSYEIGSPKVLELAKKHFGCDSLKYLWYYGGNGGYSYWKTFSMNNDIQTPSDSYKISEITLGFFEDLGYYKINYNMSQINLWGLNKGCEFVENPSEKFEEFSIEKKSNSCSQDYKFKTYSKKIEEQNLLFYLNSPIINCNSYGKDYSCLKWINNSTCAKSKCILDENNLLNIEYEYQGLKYVCKKDNELIKKDIEIKCPIINKFCDYRYECKNNCSGNGYCLNGDCICHGDYKGFACEFGINKLNDYELNKLCNFNGYHKDNKCNCYDNYSGSKCENIIIDKGSFSSKCSESKYLKCYTGGYYNYIKSSNYKKIVFHTNKNDLMPTINSNTNNSISNSNTNNINTWNNNQNSNNNTTISNNTTTNNNDTESNNISNKNNLNNENFCNTYDRFNNICKKCSIINGELLNSLKIGCKIPVIFNIFLTCENLIQEFNKLNYKCNEKNNLKIDKNCRIINNKNECTYCNTNSISNSINDYYLLNSKCKPVILKVKNCKKYENSTTCKECSNGYNLISNKCIMNLKPCLSNNLVNNICNKCEKENQVIYKDKCWEINSKINKILLLLWILIKLF